jgi:hypothetical protein
MRVRYDVRSTETRRVGGLTLRRSLYGHSAAQFPVHHAPPEGPGLRDRAVRKNHLGDRNEFIPTVHGFDEFFGNFYHLNAEEEPENPDYPKDPKFKEMFGPRGVFRCVATETASTLPADPRFGAWGRQRCEDTGPLTRKRMETIDAEVMAATMKFIDANHVDYRCADLCGDVDAARDRQRDCGGVGPLRGGCPGGRPRAHDVSRCGASGDIASDGARHPRWP